MKKITTLYLEEEIVNSAKSKGLNLSRFLESKLQDFMRINDPEYARLTGLENANHFGVGGSNPFENRFQQIPAFSKHRREYEKWLISRKLDDGYIKDLVNTLTRFIREDIIELQDDISEMQSIALRSYLTYLVQKSLLTEEGAKHFRKKVPLRQSKADNYIPTNEEVIGAYSQIKDKRYKTIFKLLAFSGARITELVKMVKEYDPSKLIIQGKFAKYKLHYNRGHKNSFYIYMPKELVPELHKFYIHVDTITHQISKSGLNPKYLRKWFYNFLIYNNVPEGVADFIEGRASSFVGSMHYLSKAKQSDYWYDKVIEELSHVITN